MVAIKLYFEPMAGTHLEDALRALRDTASADALYEHKLRAMDPDELGRLRARRSRTKGSVHRGCRGATRQAEI
jgi:hypothetical protein